MAYPYDINSIHTLNPAVPENIGALNLNEAVHEGQQLDRQHLRQARATAITLRDLRQGINLPGQYPGLTDEVVESAEWRADILNLVHAQSQYMEGNLADALQGIRDQIQTLNIRMGIREAETANVKIRLRNWLTNTRPQSVVQKTVPGLGLQLAMGLAHNATARNTIEQFSNHHPEYAGAIGAFPPPLDPNIRNYQHLDILKMILFYNEDFGIVAGQGLIDRQITFEDWLSNL